VSNHAKTVRLATPGSRNQADFPSRAHAQKAKQPAISANAAPTKYAIELTDGRADA
jgi:hypothetical protein